jgi:hypothetical protein
MSFVKTAPTASPKGIEMVRRITYVSIALLVAFSSQDSVADELEQGIQYSCSSTEVRLESIWKDGGGQENPFNESDTETAALWNIDRLRRKLPILKVCQVGKHKITTVIFKQCASGNGIGPSAAMYVDDQVSVGKSGIVAVGRSGVADSGTHPFIEARIFGSDCWQSTDESFSAILVRLAKPGEKEAQPKDTPLIVEMK